MAFIVCCFSGDCFFFTQAIRTIHDSYTRLFGSRSEEDETSEEEGEKIPEGPTSPIAEYGILPYVLKVAEITNHTYRDVLGWSLMEVLYLTCYVLDKNIADEINIKMWQNRH